jgi:hypothetical protein
MFSPVGKYGTEYLRKLIYEDIEKSTNQTSNEVNTSVNTKGDMGQAFDIHEQVDQFLKRVNEAYK